MDYRIVASSESPFGLSFERAGLIIAVLSAATLAGALGIEHIGGIQPCPLCLEQRIVYYAAIPAGLLAFALASGRRTMSTAILVLVALGFIFNAGFGVYHSGVEWGWWPGPQACSGASGPIATNPADLLKSLSQTTVVRCDEAALRIFGLSLAGYSALISLFLAAIALFGIWQSRVTSPS
jgi:disulfide bond formation protein DsbB